MLILRAKDTFSKNHFWCRLPTVVVWGRTQEPSAGTGTRGEMSVKNEKNKQISYDYNYVFSFVAQHNSICTYIITVLYACDSIK